MLIRKVKIVVQDSPKTPLHDLNKFIKYFVISNFVLSLYIIMITLKSYQYKYIYENILFQFPA